MNSNQVNRKYLLTGLLLLITVFSSGKVRSQIVFEQSYAYSGTYTMLEKEGPKFYVMDVAAGECRIYNTDYSLFKKIKLQVPLNSYLYDIQFVTQNLFDSDDGVELLYVCSEYVQTTTSYYYIYTTRVADENGSLLLDLRGGSWTDIHNLETNGSRLMVYVMDYSVYPYPVETRIYRLPGQLTGVGIVPAAAVADGKMFPNPTSGRLRAGSGGPEPGAGAEWVILDIAGHYLARIPAGQGNALDLKALGLAAGTYLVRLESKNYQTKFQQVVLNY